MKPFTNCNNKKSDCFGSSYLTCSPVTSVPLSQPNKKQRNLDKGHI